MTAIGRDYASLELDLTSGQPSRRVEAVEELLVELTGAEAAMVVNNNAGATLLALAALAAGREVIVSRGQLLESRRRLPSARRDGRQRRPAARSGNHERDPPGGLPVGASARVRPC